MNDFVDNLVSKPFVVGFAGASYSGKTTTANELKSRLIKEGYKVCLINEHARQILTEFKTTLDRIRNDKTLFMLFQNEILIRHIDNVYRSLSDDYDIILCDRTVFDIVSYVILYNHLIHDDDFTAFYVNCIKFAKHYNTLFLFQPLPMDNNYFDGVRLANEKRIMFQEILKGLIASYYLECQGFNVYEVPLMNLEDRVEYIYNIITQHV